jgi:DNA-binding SARP family transcriptional activator
MATGDASGGRANDSATLLPVSAMNDDIDIRLLGPVEVRTVDGWITAAPQQRLLLAFLALRVGQVTPVGDIVDGIWPEAPPASARASIQVMVTRVRHILADLPGGEIERCGDGYRLAIAPGSIDLHQFRSLAQTGRDAPDAMAAIAAFDQALALWRGPALADLAGTATIEAIRFALAEERLSAAQDRISALLTAGRDRQAAEELTGLMIAHPLAERLAGLLMVALCRCGRQADALQVFRDLRVRLSSELAIEPGRQVQDLHRQILTGDLALSAIAGWLRRPPDHLPRGEDLAAAERLSYQVPRQLPTGVARFVGRTAELQTLDSLAERAASSDGSVPICAVSGMAGVGKTALAVKWSHQVAHGFPDGQLYLNLRTSGPSGSPVRPTDAIRGFLDAVGIPRDRRPTDIEAQAALYRSALADKRMLVVLDDVADEEQVRPLLPGSSGCLVLTTSRRRLTGLAACEGARLIDLDVMSQQEALELLAVRLGSELIGLEPETANQLAISCGRLPLALCIASVRVTGAPPLDPAVLATQMAEARGCLDALDAGEGAGNIRAVFSSSYRNLSRPAAKMFRLLTVHPGPDIGLGAAASLAGRQVVQASRILAELTRAHVITEHLPGRWIFHDLLRAYATERAQCEEDQAELDAATLRLLDYYLQTTWAAARVLQPNRDLMSALVPPDAETASDSIANADETTAWYEAEYQVLPQIISWAEAAGLDSYARRLSSSLNEYCAMTSGARGNIVETRIAHELALRASKLSPEMSAPRHRLRAIPAGPGERWPQTSGSGNRVVAGT